jgi:hypothetical protein
MHPEKPRKLVLVRLFRRLSGENLGLMIFREGQVPFTSAIFASDFYYRIVSRSFSLAELREKAARRASAHA